MNNEEIQKLIGGYATGSLTEDERRKLLEASLDDQELFNALQGDQALKELLDDPISREQIRRAASESLPHEKASWFGRPWIWAAGASAAVAAVLLLALVQWNPNRAELKQVAVVRVEPPAPQPHDEKTDAVQAVKPAQPIERRMAAKKEVAPPTRFATATPAPKSPPAPPQQTKTELSKSAEKDVVLPPAAAPSQAAGQPEPAVATQPASQAQDKRGQVAEMQRPAAAFRSRNIAGAAGSVSPQLAFRDNGDYFFARRLEDGSYVNVPSGATFRPGETLRLTIVPNVTGPLILSEWDTAAPSWKRLYPPERETAEVRALERYTVPLDIVLKSGERLRVSVGSVAAEIPVAVR